MRRFCYTKILVLSVIILFMGLAFQPAVSKVDLEEIDVDPKEYLFQTILGISNNHDVMELFEQIEFIDDVVVCDYNFRNLYLKLLFRSPRVLFSLLFTRASVSYEYLDFAYKQGCRIVDVIGEDEALAIMEFIEITDPEFFDDLNYIIMNDEELHDRIKVLEELNNGLKSEPPLDDSPICEFLRKLENSLYVTVIFLDSICEKYPKLSPIIWPLIGFPIFLMGVITIFLMLIFNCFDWP